MQQIAIFFFFHFFNANNYHILILLSLQLISRWLSQKQSAFNGRARLSRTHFFVNFSIFTPNQSALGAWDNENDFWLANEKYREKFVSSKPTKANEVDTRAFFVFVFLTNYKK